MRAGLQTVRVAVLATIPNLTPPVIWHHGRERFVHRGCELAASRKIECACRQPVRSRLSFGRNFFELRFTPQALEIHP